MSWGWSGKAMWLTDRVGMSLCQCAQILEVEPYKYCWLKVRAKPKNGFQGNLNS